MLIDIICEWCQELKTAQTSQINNNVGKFCSHSCATLYHRSLILPEDRFWAFVSKRENCWLWLGYCSEEGGHGRFSVNNKMVLAHRYSWELHNGPIVNKLWVLHNCVPGPDNPACVNPSHLYLGNRANNVKDAINKRQHLRGSRNPNSRLTDQDAILIKERHLKGQSQRSLAGEFGVSVSTIFQVVHNKRYKND